VVAGGLTQVEQKVRVLGTPCFFQRVTQRGQKLEVRVLVYMPGKALYDDVFSPAGRDVDVPLPSTVGTLLGVLTAGRVKELFKILY
jgi:hypothetical protein